MLATRCTEHDLRKSMKIVLKKVWMKKQFKPAPFGSTMIIITENVGQNSETEPSLEIGYFGYFCYARGIISSSFELENLT